MNLFNIWNKTKQRINQKNNFFKIKEGEIWWCNLGYNIGSEVYGKGNSFLRPVLVINSDSN
jgi:mRNA interferase MazF